MRFVPSVPANDTDPGADWWVISPTSSLTTITGTNGSQTVGSADGCTVETIAALAKPELQIDMPTVSSPYASELLIINADNTTVRNLSLTGGSLGINIYSAGITDTLIEQNLIGIDPFIWLCGYCDCQFW